jgi:hypothetical protein
VKPTVQQIESLLALKRHECVGDDYWQGFLCEFHQRQRERVVARGGLRALGSRFSAWLEDLGPSKWAYGAGLAYATMTLAFFLMPEAADKVSAPVSPVNYQVVPAAVPVVEQLGELDFSSQGSAGEQVF